MPELPAPRDWKNFQKESSTICVVVFALPVESVHKFRDLVSASIEIP
jgi:hypothetical protein